MADRAGAAKPGQAAAVMLVDGDVSAGLAVLRHVNTVLPGGYRLDGAALRWPSGSAVLSEPEPRKMAARQTGSNRMLAAS